jgi:hypothetical protein
VDIIYNERDGYVTGSEQQSQQPVDHFPACHEGYSQALVFFHTTKGGEHALSSMLGASTSTQLQDFDFGYRKREPHRFGLDKPCSSAGNSSQLGPCRVPKAVAAAQTFFQRIYPIYCDLGMAPTEFQ